MTALLDLGSFQCHDVQLPLAAGSYPKLLFGKAPELALLPRPNILLGAGHATHLPMLLTKWAYKSIAIVLMRPSIPSCLFDFCLVPQHDNSKVSESIIATIGPLNCIEPGTEKDPQLGLLLIGGPSRHFGWQEAALGRQLQSILSAQGRKWVLTDSPRTPKSTREILENLAGDNVEYRPFQQGNTSITELMSRASTIWVSEDSMSMIYEALSSGAAVGVLRIPALDKNKLNGVAESLAKQQMLTLFDNWQQQQALPAPKRVLNESRRCAEEILQRLNRDASGS